MSQAMENEPSSGYTDRTERDAVMTCDTAQVFEHSSDRIAETQKQEGHKAMAVAPENPAGPLEHTEVYSDSVRRELIDGIRTTSSDLRNAVQRLNHGQLIPDLLSSICSGI